MLIQFLFRKKFNLYPNTHNIVVNCLPLSPIYAYGGERL